MMSDVCLIHPPVAFNAELDTVRCGYNEIPPLGILYLAAVLEENAINVHILDVLDARMTIDEIVCFVEKNGFSVVGISATTPQIRSAVQIAKAIRGKLGDKVHVGIGNCHVSADPRLIERYPYFDFGVIGEGEVTFLSIVKRILEGEKVKGIFVGEPVMDLDTIPFPAFQLVDLGRYRSKGLDFYPMIGTRGCPFNCIFCSRLGLSRRVRSRSPGNVCDEIEKAIDLFHGNFQFLDDSFTTNKKHVLGFCEEVIKRGLDIKWWAGGVRFNQIDRTLLEKMVRAGCTGFCLGVESGSERIRNQVVRKGVTDQQIFEGLKLIKEFRIQIQLSFVMGLPTETREDLLKTAMFPKKLLDAGYDNIDIVAITPTVPLPGARLFDQAVKDGTIDPDIIDKWINGELGDDFREGWPIYVPKGITKEELYAIRKKGYTAFYFSPKYIWKRIKTDISSWKKIKKDVLETTSLIMYGRSRGSFS